ncbi:Oidioi.mRNA.OKI2018_I69.PAR.g10149.t1.cds [Oikopleura dioica]|uniref:Oidioi.mRNA.OKI2018_I69.PAR.g10149.t1.cds n=1 Tax=Oikopleura dioica TaxID=34765 RepID=A0ABN7RP40_OIKDI|nr:Oidioi.mRNA.OKI2018_I69.PAR.g10149.t1.cds [Oikopleura dioica]
MPYSTEKLQIVDMNEFSLNILYSKYLQSAPQFENFVKASTRSRQPNVEDLNSKTCTDVDQQLIEVIIDENVTRNEAEFYNDFFEQFKEEFEEDINLKYGSSISIPDFLGKSQQTLQKEPIEEVEGKSDLPPYPTTDVFQEKVIQKVVAAFDGECKGTFTDICDKTFIVAARKPFSINGNDIPDARFEEKYFQEDPNQKYFRWTKDDRTITVIPANIRNPTVAVDSFTSILCSHSGINAGGGAGDGGSRKRRWNHPKRVRGFRRGQRRNPNKSYYSRSSFLRSN